METSEVRGKKTSVNTITAIWGNGGEDIARVDREEP